MHRLGVRRFYGVVGVALATGIGAGFAACSGDHNSPATPTTTDASPLDGKAARDTAAEEVDADVVGPDRLSETGLYSDIASKTPTPGLVPFTPRFSFWSDGIEKTRWLSLPPGTQIDTKAMDHWIFPVGTKVWKEFRVDGKLVETRLLMKVRDDAPKGWWMAAYVWLPDGSDAIASLDGVPNALGSGHDVPNRIDCFNCHQGVSDVLIGVSAIQLSHTGDSYHFDGGIADAETDADAAPQTSDAGASFLTRFTADGMLSQPPPGDFDVPGDGIVKDALAYMHANCGNCHNDESPRLNTQTKMRLRLLVGQTAPEQTGAYTTTIGTVMKHQVDAATEVVVPKSPDLSGIWVRMGHRLDAHSMPPVGTQKVDEVGREIIRQWIMGLN